MRKLLYIFLLCVTCGSLSAAERKRATTRVDVLPRSGLEQVIGAH